MANKYCDCGARTSYNSAEPKFCSGCGKSFSDLVVIASNPPKARHSSPVIFTQPEEEDVIPQIDKLEIEIKGRRGGGAPTVETIGKIWGTDQIVIDRGNPVKGKKLSKAKILADFQKDATPRSRNNPIDFDIPGDS